MNRVLRCLAALAFLPLAFGRAEESITDISPDEKFAGRSDEAKARSWRSERATRKQVIDLHAAVLRTGASVHWAPDSRHFTIARPAAKRIRREIVAWNCMGVTAKAFE